MSFLSKVSLFFCFLLVSLLLCWMFGSLGLLFTLSSMGGAFLDIMFELLCNEVSVTCLVMLVCCGSIALYYCHHYFGGDVEGYLLFPLVVWFLGVMALLVLSSSLISTLILWEYLGLVSFLLILFYSNGASLRAALVTLFASRFGDAALFVLVMWAYCWPESFSLVNVTVLLGLVIMTKSASYPFISWLLEAMRAPTPVSSLVHSSTLVAAGVWFVLRYSHLVESPTQTVLFYVSLLTVIVTGVCASYFCDLKKIVALSTCNNISWCIIFFVSGNSGLCLLQLLTHGVCKCYLFMSVGDLMSLSGGSQSSVGVYLSRYTGVYGAFIQVLLVLSLSGLPFMGVYFSKHCLFSSFLYSYGVGLGLVLLCGFLLTYIYSMRLVFLLVGSGQGLSSGYSSSFLMICLLSLLGTLINFVGGFAFYGEEVGVAAGASGLLLFVQLLGCFMGFLLYYFNGAGRQGVWESLVWGGDCLVNFLYSIYLSISTSCILAFYRWEMYFGLNTNIILHPFPKGVKALFSLNFMVCSLCYLFFYLVFLSGIV